MMETNDRYKIVRQYFERGRSRRTLKRGLTLDEARAHCRDPETSSSTCTNEAGKATTRRVGEWFDSFAQDDSVG